MQAWRSAASEIRVWGFRGLGFKGFGVVVDGARCKVYADFVPQSGPIADQVQHRSR